MYNYYDGQNQNMSPYNNYGRMNYNPLNNGMNMKNLPHYEVIRVNGRAGAEAFQMVENSSVLLLDETANIIWFAQTDGAGYKTLTPFTITQYIEQPPVDVNDLNDRVAQLENMIAEIKEAVSSGKSNTGNDAKPTKKQGRATSSLIPE